MLDRLLAFGAVFDWISPLWAYIQDVLNGPSHTFLVPHDAGWSGREIERLLRQHGVHVWGLMIVDGLIMFTVRQAQARWAQYLLQRAGVPIAYGLLDETAPTASSAPEKPSSPPLDARIDAWLAKLDGLLDRL